MKIQPTNTSITNNTYTPTTNITKKRTNIYSTNSLNSTEMYQNEVSFKGYYNIFNIDWASFNFERLTPIIKTILKKIDIDTPIKEGIARKYKEQNLIGLMDEQQQFTDKFVHPFLKSLVFDDEIPVPPAILIHGAERNSISKLVESWTLIPKKHFDIDMPRISNIQNNQFIPTITNLIKNPISWRQAIIIKDAENYLGMNYNQALRLRDFYYNSDDIRILQSNNNFDNINYFKSLLDSCGESRDAGGYGTTFLFTSQRPHLIHPDFRRGKLEKLEVSRPKDNNIAQLFVDILHQKSPTPPMLNEEQLQAISLVSKVDPIKGGFSYDDLTQIASEIQKLHKENNLDFIIDTLKYAPRSYSPEEIVRQNQISEVFTHKPSQYEVLRGKYENGEITPVEEKILEDLKLKNKIRIKTLKDKEQMGSLNIFEKDELKYLRNLED